MIKYIRNAITYALEVLFPTYCVGCHTPKTPLCQHCVSSISPASPPYNQSRSAHDRSRQNISALFSYHDKIMRKSIWSLKYRNNTRMAKIFARLLRDCLIEEMAEWRQFSTEPIILIPIPISRARKRKRGYNQIELILKALQDDIKDMSFIYLLNVLYKSTETPSQMTIKNRKQRLQNIKNSFSVKNSHLIKGKRIIIIDDITTTGATLHEAIRVLKKAGAKKVEGLALAH